MRHCPLTQLTDPLADGAVQGVQLVPQVFTELLDTHWPLQSWKPLLQVSTHCPALQELTPLGEVGHGVQRVPQLFTDASDTQTPLHRW